MSSAGPALPTTADQDTLWTLEAWRGLAAWLVVYAHLNPLAGLDVPLLRFAYTGVDLFFVLSGFVFAPYFFGRRLQLGGFALRRLFRIYPAYLAALLLYVAMAAQAGQPLNYLWEHLVFAHLQSREMTFYYNPVFWSLPSEVEFYLALPLLALLAGGSAWRLGGLVLVALLARLALGHASDPETGDAVFIWMHHLPGMGVEFLFGVCAWKLSSRLTGWGPRLALLAAGIAGWIGLAALFAAQGDPGLNAGLLRGQISWLAALCYAAALVATAQPPQRVAPGLVTMALWAGRLSYGTYLLHIAAMRLVQPHAAALGPAGTTLAACTLTLGGAWLLYQLWENPWRRFGRALAKRFQSRRTQAPAAAQSPGGV
jgi:peptidoglycan/LPS O-acetylase OafA/YrhL